MLGNSGFISTQHAQYVTILVLAVILTSLNFTDLLALTLAAHTQLCVLATANVLTFLCTAAELADLVRELQEVNNWIPFGLYLGIKMSRLEAIKVDCPTFEDHRTQMLSEWQKKVTPTWSAVVQALDEIGMRVWLLSQHKSMVG